MTRVEPDIDPLVRQLVVAGDGDRDTPVEVAGDRPRLQLLDKVEREPSHVRSPVLLALDPRSQLLLERRQVQEEVLRQSEHRRRPVDRRAWLDQVSGIELVPAVVALITASALVPADWAGAFDVAVRERMPRRGRERAERLLLDDVAILEEGSERILRDAVVVLRRRPREEGRTRPEGEKILSNQAVEPFGGLTRRLAQGVGRDHDRVPCSSVPLTMGRRSRGAGGTGRTYPTVRRTRAT